MMEKNKWNARPLTGLCTTRVEWYFYNHRGLACFCGLQKNMGRKGLWLLSFFFFLKNPTKLFNLSAKEM